MNQDTPERSAAESREIALSVLSDVFKEINGWRPRGLYRTEDMSEQDAWDEIDRLYAAQEAAAEERAARQAEADKRREDAMKAEPLKHNPFAALQGRV